MGRQQNVQIRVYEQLLFSIPMCKLSDLRQTIVRLESSGESAKLEHANALKKCAEDGDRALVESAEQFKAKLIVEYQKFETLSEKYKVRTMNCRETALGAIQS